MSPGTPSMLTESLAVLGIKEARALIADSDAPGDTLAALARHVEATIRVEAISHPSCPRTALAAASSDPSDTVRYAAAANPRTPEHALAELVAAENLADGGRALFAAAANPSLPGNCARELLATAEALAAALRTSQALSITLGAGIQQSEPPGTGHSVPPRSRTLLLGDHLDYNGINDRLLALCVDPDTAPGTLDEIACHPVASPMIVAAAGLHPHAPASLVNSPITQRAITEHEDSFRTASDIARTLGGLGTTLLAERSVRECMCLSARYGGVTFCGVHLAGAPTEPTAVARAAFWEGETGMVLEPEVASYVSVYADRWVAAAVAAPPQPAPEPEHISIGL